MKDRITSQSQALYVGPSQTGTFGSVVLSGLVPTELQRIQSISHYVDTSNEPIYQLGSFNPLGHKNAQSPEVQLEFNYVLGDAQNEKWLGFDLGKLEVPAISGFLSGINDDQNFYVATKKRGDIATTGTLQSFLSQEDMAVYAFGNGVIENYKMVASLYEIPSATVRVNANTMATYSGCSGIPSPSVDGSGCNATGKLIIPPARESSLEVDSLRAPYIDLNFGTALLKGGGPLLPGNTITNDYSACSLESFSLELSLERDDIGTLGNNYKVLHPIRFPATVSLECIAKSRDGATGDLNQLFCGDSRDIVIEFNSPVTSSGNMSVALKSAYLQSKVYSHDVAGQEIVTLSFVSALNGDSSTTGFFMSGVAGTCQETTYGITTGQLLNDEVAVRPERTSTQYTYWTDPCVADVCDSPPGFDTQITGTCESRVGALGDGEPYLIHTGQQDGEITISADAMYGGVNSLAPIGHKLTKNDIEVETIEVDWGTVTYSNSCKLFVAEVGLDPVTFGPIKAAKGDVFKVVSCCPYDTWPQSYAFYTRVTETYCPV